MKTLGATRKMLTGTYVLEYAILGLATAAFATIAGGFSAWYVIARIMKLPFDTVPGPVATTLALGLVITISIGLAGTWRVLGEKPATHLREL
jgi:putative ABC transport system permease protein